MKFVVSCNLLQNNLQTIGRVIAAQNPIPVLRCFLFELSGNQLKITAADNETRMSTSIEVHDVEGSGVFAIPAKSLLDALKELPEQPVTFEIDDNSLNMFIYYKNGKYNFVAERGDEYPMAKPLAADASKLTVSAQDLLTGISRSLFATADDELRPVMNGIYFDISPENLTFVASDGHKLVRFKNLQVTGNERAAFNLPKKPANYLRTILPKEGGDVTIGFDSSNAYFMMENMTLIARLIEGRYPNYNAVIPVDNPYRVTVDCIQLLAALKRVSVFSDQASSLIKLNISGGSIIISAQDINLSSSAEETISCVYEGEPMSIGFKATYLIEILNNIPSAEAILELADPSRAGLILPSENEENEDLLMLLMPMMLND